jgi:hypothetical protein
MTQFNISDINEQSAEQIDVAQLEAVVGGSMLDVLSPQLRLAATQVGPVFKDVFAKIIPFTY